MPAVPAWPPRSLPRLFVGVGLAEGTPVALDPAQANYLGNVLRMGEGAELLLFDGRSGEWLARVAEAGRKRMTLTVERRTREAEQLPNLTLAFAPVKRAQTDWLVEKATELGVRRLQPVMTRRTVAERVKLERLEAIAIEAAEQCGRTVLPTISEPVGLARFLESWSGTLLFADETGGLPIGEAFAPSVACGDSSSSSPGERQERSSPGKLAERAAKATAILVGPEGGFTPEERDLVRAHPQATAISLGPRILRAETAALAAVTAYMALAGDWR